MLAPSDLGASLPAAEPAGVHRSVRWIRAGDTEDVQRAAVAVLLFASVAAAALVQGGFFARGQFAVAGLVGAAAVVGVRIGGLRDHDVRPVAVWAGLLAAWLVLRGLLNGSFPTGAGGAVLIAELVVVIAISRGLDESTREAIVAGLLGLGAFVAMVGWAGVAWRVQPLALPSDGLWRAASTLTYANATAALLVPLALVALALRPERPRSIPLALTSMVLLTGITATLSRAGLLCLLGGFAVLVVIRGRVAIRALAAPLVGAALALAGTLPSIPAGAPPRPAVALLALVAGLGATALLTLSSRSRWSTVTIGAVLFGMALVGIAEAGAGPLADSARSIWSARGSLASPGRSYGIRDGARMVDAHPWIGAGPGQVVLHSGGRYWPFFHDEYLQVLVELGVVGGILLLGLLLAVGHALRRSRPPGSATGLWAGVVAACAATAVHGGFDFIWHVPAIPLAVVLLVGLVIAPPGRFVQRPEGKGGKG